jgi:hypothetical protein
MDALAPPHREARWAVEEPPADRARTALAAAETVRRAGIAGEPAALLRLTHLMRMKDRYEAAIAECMELLAQTAQL